MQDPTPFDAIRDAVRILQYADDVYAPQRYTQRTAKDYLKAQCIEPLQHEVTQLMAEIATKFDDDFGRQDSSENHKRAYAQQKIVQDQLRWVLDIIQGVFSDKNKESAMFPSAEDKESLAGLLHALDDFEKVMEKSRAIISKLAADPRKRPSLRETVKSGLELFRKGKEG
jgi:hypothetical protein